MPQDPWESWNRGIYKINDKLDRAIAKPVASGYVRVVPQPIRTGVTNFFDNLDNDDGHDQRRPAGKIPRVGERSGSLPAQFDRGDWAAYSIRPRPAGLDKNNEDFGQTLGHWGVHPGPFVELPVLGPSDLRDAPARLVDAYTNPHAVHP